ncbi:hypothetical protein [Paraflavitalea speifideaquila]|uniref:hypothetical protein n=1 Tax=Paraflavitalea speifideaquila TaxID=3076558 RepID=UPI0028E1FD23|nr:hypothetical protein [Paraflavitalea speifideiaquila]
MKCKVVYPLLLLLLSGLYATAQDLYSGVWRKGNGSTYLWAGVSWADFNKNGVNWPNKTFDLLTLKLMKQVESDTSPVYGKAAAMVMP